MCRRSWNRKPLKPRAREPEANGGCIGSPDQAPCPPGKGRRDRPQLRAFRSRMLLTIACPAESATLIRRVKGAKCLGVRIGDWLSIDHSRRLLQMWRSIAPTLSQIIWPTTLERLDTQNAPAVRSKIFTRFIDSKKSRRSHPPEITRLFHGLCRRHKGNDPTAARDPMDRERRPVDCPCLRRS